MQSEKEAFEKATAADNEALPAMSDRQPGHRRIQSEAIKKLQASVEEEEKKAIVTERFPEI